MRAAIRENIVRGADLIKIFHSGFVEFTEIRRFL
jgi:hypothetical protein